MKRLEAPIAAALILGALWLATPVIHTLRHQCPVRPDGVDQAEALPAFARKYKVSCTQCHSGFPVLNAYGRQFKMNGFTRESGSTEGVLKSQDGTLWTEGAFPWAAIIRSRPFDNGKGNLSNQGVQMGGTGGPASSTNPNNFKMQALNDVDMFVAGGDAAYKVSYFGELDANSAGNFSPSFGDLRLGYHPMQQFNVVVARRGFFADDPYQTIVSNESPTIANRATDLLMSDQGSITGTPLLSSPQQMIEAYGMVDLKGDSFLYYAAAATKDQATNAANTSSVDTGLQTQSPTNANARLAFDTGKGQMIGVFGAYGHQWPTSVGGVGGNLGVDPGVFAQQQFVRGGFDALWEQGDLAARGAYVYAKDRDYVADINDTNHAAYVEVSYAFKRNHESYPFLLPLLRQNWYTTFNGTQKFSFATAQLAHYFAPNFKAFLEYSVDTGRGFQGGTQADPTTGTLIPWGNRTTLQIEVGF